QHLGGAVRGGFGRPGGRPGPAASWCRSGAQRRGGGDRVGRGGAGPPGGRGGLAGPEPGYGERGPAGRRHRAVRRAARRRAGQGRRRGHGDRGPARLRRARLRLMEPNGPGEPALVPLERLPGRTQWAFSHAGRSFAVFEVAGELVVTDGACPHNGGPLAEGLVRDGVVTCPWHWYSYELATGRCRTGAGYELRRGPGGAGVGVAAAA